MNSTINLLPVSFRKRLLVWARIRQWLVYGGVILILMICWSTSSYLRMRAENSQLTELTLNAESLRRMNGVNQRLADQSDDLAAKESSISKIKNVGLHLQVLGMVSRCARPLGEKLQISHYRLEENLRQNNSVQKPTFVTSTRSSKQAVTSNQPVKVMHLELKGLAENDASIAEYVRELEKSECFDVVELKVVNRVEMKSQIVRTYQIECTF